MGHVGTQSHPHQVHPFLSLPQDSQKHDCSLQVLKLLGWCKQPTCPIPVVLMENGQEESGTNIDCPPPGTLEIRALQDVYIAPFLFKKGLC